ncbi:class II aaRS and biotin synthetase [Lophium mytilinum]|uniref:proline--tRNA ligase n=1 Tax=Lophium mytilinum TaxID=390894 RepID=A0A6A6QVW6_9PEZI|nr:class II aaRS and biotin synthetase [Lophium mytilinum]
MLIDGANSLLIRAGFLRQAHSGIFHLLPLGLRVQEKLEKLVDKHMRSIGASKVSLSSITSEDLWRRSGRYSEDSELLRLKDRKESGFLLSPTHEEEITALAAAIVKSYKDLPLRVYQISRKYRDERRPRQGLLRAKEFLMKDLYTFDYSTEMALTTYESVRKAYAAFFNELKIPYLVADADSGAMGGTLSHEYHYVSPLGEDHVISCNACDYVANEELAEKGGNYSSDPGLPITTWRGIGKDGCPVAVYIPAPPSATGGQLSAKWPDHLNLHAVSDAYPDLDTTIEEPLKDSFFNTRKVVHIIDRRLSFLPELIPREDGTVIVTSHPKTDIPLDLTRIQPNDPCPRCSDGTLNVQRAIEVGHTFHLGTRYSEPLEATVNVPLQGLVALQMGCHGIGMSRLIAAVASRKATESGLGWPRAIAPFECVIIPAKGAEEDAEKLYDELSGDIDTILDDRPIKDFNFAWKMGDADLIGYPVSIRLGRGWKQEKKVEIECKAAGVRLNVEFAGVKQTVVELLAGL